MQKMAADNTGLVATLHMSHWEGTKNYALIEYASGGNLMEFVAKFPHGLVRVDDGYLAQLIFAQLTLGIKYMHEANVTHVDFKPQNVMINKKECADLESARCRQGIQDQACTMSQ